MWTRMCSHEDPAAHAATCQDCQETVIAMAAMRELAAQPLPDAERPGASASYLWWKADLLRRWDAQQRAVEPVEIGERIGAGIGIVGAAILLLWLWRQVGSPAVSTLTGDSGVQTALPWLMALMLGVCALVLGATAVAVLDVGDRNRKD